MDKLNFNLNRMIFHVHLRRHNYVFLFAAISLFIIALNVFNIFPSNFFLQLISLCATAFVILFLPTYPLIFLIFNKNNLTFFEKLSITIALNLTFYILVGYIGNAFGILVTGFFYFISILIIYFFLICYCFLIDFRKKTLFFIPMGSKAEQFKLFDRDFSLIAYIKKKIHINVLLLILFLILLSVLHGIRFSYFYGTDAMYHVFLMDLISKLNYLPTNQYFGALGLHIFGAVINFFTNINVILIGKYFLFYTYFVSALIFYNILLRIFKNRNIAIFGVFLLESSSLGFSVMMYEFWPTSLATILSLQIFLLLYIRLQSLISPERPNKKVLLSNMIFNYILIILLGISAIFTHSLISMIYIVSFSFVFLIYFVKNYRRGIDFSILSTLLLIFLLLYESTDISRHWQLADFLSLPWYFFVLGIAAGVFLILYFRRGINFTTGRFEEIIKGKKYRYYKTFEDKYIFPLLYSFIVILLFVFWYLNSFFLDMYFTKIFILIESLIFGFFCFWGLILFQKKIENLLKKLLGMKLTYQP